MTNAKDVLEWMERKEKREIEQTKEEWFCQLPTDEKAKVLETIIIKYLLLKQPKCYEITKREFWELWLKEIHQ